MEGVLNEMRADIWTQKEGELRLMIVNGKPCCDWCGEMLDAKCDLDDASGWTDWRTAKRHCCHGCEDKLLDGSGYPPCWKCETHPCERDRDCWASPPLHLFPYETFFANSLGPAVLDLSKADAKEIGPRPSECSLTRWMPSE